MNYNFSIGDEVKASVNPLGSAWYKIIGLADQNGFYAAELLGQPDDHPIQILIHRNSIISIRK